MVDTKQLQLLADVLSESHPVSEPCNDTESSAAHHIQHTFSFCLVSVGRFTAAGDMMDCVDRTEEGR